MDLEELRTVREQERRTDSLQHLRDSFYDDATEYVRELKRERSRRAEAAGDPYAPEAMRLTDEIDTAAEVIESLYERRRGKVVKLASFAAAGMPAEKDGMTDQERTMFHDLVERIEANEDEVLGSLEDVDVESEATGVPEADPPAVTGGDATADAGSPSDATEATGEEPTHVIGDPTATDSEPGTPGPADATAEDAPPEAAPTAGGPDAAESVAADAGRESPAESRPEDADDLGTAPDSPDDGGVLADAMGGESSSSTGSETVNGAATTSETSGQTAASGGTAGGSTSAGAADTAGSAESTGPGESTDRPESIASATAETGGSAATTTPTAETDATAASEAGTAGIGSSSASTDTTDRPTGEAAVAAGGADRTTTASDTSASSDGEAVGGTTDGASSATNGTSSATAAETQSAERTTVRVTTDVGEIFGIDDRSYELRADDVVHLPTANAEPLIQQDAAEPLE